jgi:hypothetical protein
MEKIMKTYLSQAVVCCICNFSNATHTLHKNGLATPVCISCGRKESKCNWCLLDASNGDCCDFHAKKPGCVPMGKLYKVWKELFILSNTVIAGRYKNEENLKQLNEKFQYQLALCGYDFERWEKRIAPVLNCQPVIPIERFVEIIEANYELPQTAAAVCVAVY